MPFCLKRKKFPRLSSSAQEFCSPAKLSEAEGSAKCHALAPKEWPALAAQVFKSMQCIAAASRTTVARNNVPGPLSMTLRNMHSALQ